MNRLPGGKDEEQTQTCFPRINHTPCITYLASLHLQYPKMHSTQNNQRALKTINHTWKLGSLLGCISSVTQL